MTSIYLIIFCYSIHSTWSTEKKTLAHTVINTSNTIKVSTPSIRYHFNSPIQLSFPFELSYVRSFSAVPRHRVVSSCLTSMFVSGTQILWTHQADWKPSGVTGDFNTYRLLCVRLLMLLSWMPLLRLHLVFFLVLLLFAHFLDPSSFRTTNCLLPWLTVLLVHPFTGNCEFNNAAV